MCGIAGIIGNKATEDGVLKLLDAQKHRGPDNTNYYLEQQNIVLGHNRLSIIDLSAEANQPFFSTCNNFIIVFNGEIYNYLELKSELASSFDFKTKSDTEVLLNAYTKWGKDCLDKLNGMFSFAIWDKKEQKLFAARDRFGVKPFYYLFNQENFVFASELKPFFDFGIPKIPNEKVWSNYFKNGSYGQPYETFWNDIQQLPGGHFLEVQDGKISTKQWYFFEKNVREKKHILNSNEEEYITDLMLKAVNLRFRADVPVGFNLSGGLDSSILLALIDQQPIDKKSVEAFTFITNDENYDELPWVELLLKDKSFPLNTCLLSKDEIPYLSEKISQHQLEPYGGLPTLAYSKIFEKASSLGVKVLLDGQGSDEAWAGYDYYLNNSQSTIQGVTKLPFKPNVLTSDFEMLSEQIDYPKPFENPIENLQFRDLFYTKIPRALRFNDRVSMLYSTELREPFLDYQLVEYVFSRPIDFKIKNGVQKWLLRKIAEKFLQKDLVLTPKRPLQTPQREWLSTDLKDWVIAEVEFLANHSWFDKRNLEIELANFYKGDNQSSFYIWQWINAKQILY